MQKTMKKKSVKRKISIDEGRESDQERKRCWKIGLGGWNHGSSKAKGETEGDEGFAKPWNRPGTETISQSIGVIC